MTFGSEHLSKEAAHHFDQIDPLASYRDEFVFPQKSDGSSQLYFAGHSLGLMPKKTPQYIQEELDDWGRWAVEGHFHARHPWLPYHENLTAQTARLVGAKESEVVTMNGLTVNLHLMMVSFYRPTSSRYKILIENNTFPSDKYAVDSQARFHGFDPKEAVVELKPEPGSLTVSEKQIQSEIEELGDSLALILLGNCNYLSGQCFNFESVTQAGHQVGAIVGFNLAHGAGNLLLKLHQWNVDFAVWCSYKYLNSGPGGIAGAFVHERHLTDQSIPRFEGWWGTNKTTRFEMGPQFDPIPTAEAWQLSNPPIFQMASLRASMDLFDRATMPALRKKGDHLTAYLEFLINKKLEGVCEIVTPSFSTESPSRGSMLCVRLTSGDPKKMAANLTALGVIVDFREPNILRMAPAPLYNSYGDIFSLVEAIQEISHA